MEIAQAYIVLIAELPAEKHDCTAMKIGLQCINVFICYINCLKDREH